MPGAYPRRPWTALLAAASMLMPLAASGEAVYSKLESKSRCWDYRIPDVASKTECFTSAANMTGLRGTKALQLDNLGFSGCIFNSAANFLMFGVTNGITPNKTSISESWHYLCKGVPTSTTSTTSTSTSVTITTGPYAKLEAGARCSDYKIPDVLSQDDCFGVALATVGLHGKPTYRLDHIGFNGCIFNTAAQVVMFGETPGIAPANNPALPVWQFICLGVPTTTTIAP